MEKDNVGGRPHNGNGISFSTARDPNVQFQFGHVYFARDFKMGDAVEAGELIGFAALGETANDFDIDLFCQTPTGREVIYGSVFEHMTPTVLAAFAAVGVTPANVELTKADRDARPCDFAATAARSDQPLTIRPDGSIDPEAGTPPHDWEGLRKSLADAAATDLPRKPARRLGGS